MDLKDYFEKTKGMGILSTSSQDGRVNAAVYARPHFNGDGQVAFIMADKLSHKNLQENPWACFLFKEDGPGHQGKRLYLKKVRETDDDQAIRQVRNKGPLACCECSGQTKYLVSFTIDNELPLVGDKQA